MGNPQKLQDVQINMVPGEEGPNQIPVKDPNLDKLMGSNGVRIKPAAAYTAQSFDSIILLADTIFTVFKVTKNGTESSQLVNWGFDGVTLPAGLYIPAGHGAKITAFTADVSVACY